jgi:hypothetical protein
MSHRATTPDRRARVLAEAVVSAYIDEIARPAHPRHRATEPARTIGRRPIGARRAPRREREPVAA